MLLTVLHFKATVVKGLIMAATSILAMQHMARTQATVISMDDEHVRSKNVELRDFFWDRVITTMLVLLFGVTSVQAIVSYLSDEEVVCAITENHTTSIQRYINQLCQKDTPNYGKFYNIGLYSEIAILSGLHVFWSQVWSGRIETFKSTVNAMSLERNKSGQFEASDLSSVRYLERNLESTTLTWTYMLKIGGQITVCLLSFALLTFYPNLGFSYATQTMQVFECHNDSFVDSAGQWPLTAANVYCVSSELSNLQILRWFNFAALVVIILANTLGTFLLAYSLYYYHLLDYKRVARFILYTGLRRDHYPEHHYKSGCSGKYEMCSGGFTHSWSFLIFSLFWYCKYNKCCSREGGCCCSPCCGCCDDENLNEGLIPFDMSFLVVRLHGSHTKMGEALLNVLIDNHVDYRIKNECSKIKHFALGRDDSLSKIVEGMLSVVPIV